MLGTAKQHSFLPRMRCSGGFREEESMDTGLKTREKTTVYVIKIAIAAILALVSIFVISPRVSSTAFFSGTIASLEKVRSVVLGLTGASTAASAAITLLPDDICSPIASQLMDLTDDFMIILCAVYFEKYMLTVIGYLSFTYIIPASMGLYAVNVFLRKERLRTLAIKLCVFGICAFLVIPVSVKVSELINETHRDSIQATISAAEESVTEIEAASKSAEAGKIQNEKKNVFQKLFEAVEGGLETISQNVTMVTEKLKRIVDNFIDALAVLIVTSCVIPLAIAAIFAWLIKALFRLEITVPELRQGHGHVRRDEEDRYY